METQEDFLKMFIFYAERNSPVSLLNQEQIETLWNFVDNHKDEIHPQVFSICQGAKRQLEWYYADGEVTEGYDKAFYVGILSSVCWGFVSPQKDGDWYDHPEDFPDFFEKQLFN